MMAGRYGMLTKAVECMKLLAGVTAIAQNRGRQPCSAGWRSRECSGFARFQANPAKSSDFTDNINGQLFTKRF